MKRIIFLSLICLGICGCESNSNSGMTNSAGPTNNSGGMNRDAVRHDNTGVNARDSDTAAKTPFDQKDNQADLDITANIRKQVVATKMSVNAQNVKIITQDGKVTLRGPVASDDEKKKIEDIANFVAGKDKVTSELDVERNH